jgi:hypothetical protein
MQRTDLNAFGEMLDAVCSLLSRGAYQPNSMNTALFFRALARYSLTEVRAGFDAHVADKQRGRFVPVPSDIIAQIEGAAADDGRPGAEEAWAKAVRSADEFETVVWTAEMAQAWAEVAPLYGQGDQVGARMAFKEIYARLVDEARSARRRVTWTAALGFDPERRALALAASAHLLAPHPDMTRIEGGPRVLLAGPVQSAARIGVLVNAAPEEVCQRLQALRVRLTGTADAVSPDAAARQRTETLRRRAAALVAKRMPINEVAR